MVLSIAAFGNAMSWETGFSSSAATKVDEDVHEKTTSSLNSGKLSKGHQQTFTHSLYLVSTHLIGMLIAPSWSLVFTKKLREIRRSFIELKVSLFIVNVGARMSESP
jgi:hypothetical protein